VSNTRSLSSSAKPLSIIGQLTSLAGKRLDEESLKQFPGAREATMEQERTDRRRARRLPREIWALGFVSLFMDTSSELVHSLLPVFVVTTLGASALALGAIEGVAEAATLIVRTFSGAISDYVQRRKLLAVIGYGLAAATKPFFALATSVDWVFGARLIDRIGKGIRGAPRDALIADVTPPSLRGAAFGLRQSLDTVGAVAGPLLAIGLMALLTDNIRAVLWFAVIPAVVSVLTLIFTVREPPRTADAPERPRIRWSTLRQLPPAFWRVVAIGAVFTLARFSEAFLVLRAEDTGLSIGLVPMVMVVMSAVYALAAYPTGILADRMRASGLLLAGLIVLVLADLVLAFANSAGVTLLGAGLWGLHMGLTQGLLAKLIADSAPPALRGTAFGMFSLVAGVATLLASIIAGALWDGPGPQVTFFVGGGLSVAAAVALVATRPRRAT
jgi:MFS family permease